MDPVLELMWNLIRAYHLNHAAAGITSGSLDSSTHPRPSVPSFFLARRTTKQHRNGGVQGENAAVGERQARRLQRQGGRLQGQVHHPFCVIHHMFVCVRVCVCVCARARVCVCACAC